ncbi:hypothetical protein NP233_g12287 [Leucocoprinus birnbaumii]|uniref:Uncharacterized protein n=1 Tax=Leucocoprinus birnbaumii TaxID=56174 RepID=A0AAD5VEP4_9AGAR|nr:hypothetical protein NP233_g12287 [Leucocoprinus birnbaumii]
MLSFSLIVAVDSRQNSSSPLDDASNTQQYSNIMRHLRRRRAPEIIAAGGTLPSSSMRGPSISPDRRARFRKHLKHRRVLNATAAGNIPPSSSHGPSVSHKSQARRAGSRQRSKPSLSSFPPLPRPKMKQWKLTRNGPASSGLLANEPSPLSSSSDGGLTPPPFCEKEFTLPEDIKAKLEAEGTPPPILTKEEEDQIIKRFAGTPVTVTEMASSPPALSPSLSELEGMRGMIPAALRCHTVFNLDDGDELVAATEADYKASRRWYRDNYDVLFGGKNESPLETSVAGPSTPPHRHKGKKRAVSEESSPSPLVHRNLSPMNKPKNKRARREYH